MVCFYYCFRQTLRVRWFCFGSDGATHVLCNDNTSHDIGPTSRGRVMLLGRAGGCVWGWYRMWGRREPWAMLGNMVLLRECSVVHATSTLVTSIGYACPWPTFRRDSFRVFGNVVSLQYEIVLVGYTTALHCTIALLQLKWCFRETAAAMLYMKSRWCTNRLCVGVLLHYS